MASDLLVVAGIEAVDDILAYLRVPVAKALDPLNRADFLVIQKRFADELKGVSRADEAAAVKRVLGTLDVDWKKLNEAQRDKIVQVSRDALAAAPKPALPKLEAVFTKNGVQMVKDTKSATQNAWPAMKVDVSVTDTDRRIVERAAKAQAHYVTTAAGVRADQFSKQARVIVSRGLEQGLGRGAIAEELKAALGAHVQKSDAYWNMVAGVHMVRSRTYGSLVSYQESGIQRFTFEAVLDEVTTLQCRFLHGRSFSVAVALQKYQEVEAADDPEAVKEIQPWLNVGKDDKGQQVLYVKTGGAKTPVADVKESALGRADEIGKFSARMTDEALAQLGCVVPPLHGNCRSTLIPDMSSMRASPAPVAPRAARPAAPTAPRAPAPAAPAVPPPGAPVAPAPRAAAPAAAPKPLAPAQPAQPGAVVAVPEAAPVAAAPPAAAQLTPPTQLPDGAVLASKPAHAAVKEGVHFKRMLVGETKLTAAERAKVLDAVREKGLLEFMERAPIPTLEISDVPKSKANGIYWQGSKLRLWSGRPSFSYGKTWDDTFSVSNLAPDKLQAMQRTLIHELGHHVHMHDWGRSAGKPIDAVVRKAFLAAKKAGSPVTEYAFKNRDEYFAECFAAYHYENAMLKQYDPIGYAMVKDVMRLRGIIK